MKTDSPRIGTSLILKIHADRSFSQGVVRKSDDHGCDPIRKAYQAKLRAERSTGEARFHSHEEFNDVLWQSTPQGLSNLPNLLREKSRRGLLGITAHGRRLIRSSCAVLEQNFQRKQLSFQTCTMPEVEGGVTRHEWSRVVKIWRDRMVRLLSFKGLPTHIVGCTEIQEKRWKRTGFVCPHLHVVYVGRWANESWAYTPKDLNQVWIECLQIVFGSRLNTSCLTNAVDVKQVKKSAAAYLSKYMSKGGTMLQQIVQTSGEDFIPTTWTLCTRELNRWVRQSIVYLTNSAAEDGWKLIQSMRETFVQWWKPVSVQMTDGLEVVMGWYGTLTPAGYEGLQDYHALMR